MAEDLGGTSRYICTEHPLAQVWWASQHLPVNQVQDWEENLQGQDGLSAPSSAHLHPRIPAVNAFIFHHTDLLLEAGWCDGSIDPMMPQQSCPAPPGTYLSRSGYGDVAREVCELEHNYTLLTERLK